MRAARSDSERMTLEAALAVGVLLAGREALGPREDGGQRVVQFVRDARDRLAQRGELLGLQQLAVEVARLVVQLLAVADVADQGLDEQAPALLPVGLRGDLHPDRGEVDAADADEEVGDGAVVAQPLEEARARERIDEAAALERLHLLIVGPGVVPEDELELTVRGEGSVGTPGVEHDDAGAHLGTLEEAGGHRQTFVGTCGDGGQASRRHGGIIRSACRPAAGGALALLFFPKKKAKTPAIRPSPRIDDDDLGGIEHPTPFSSAGCWPAPRRWRTTSRRRRASGSAASR